VARCLIIGCGCRGRSLARELIARGHAVRGTTRHAEHARPIEAIGAEAFVGDPDVIATLTRALDRVTVAVVLLGSASGSPAQLAALHGTRLDMLLSRMIDTTIRGVVYEATGSVQPDILEAGGARVRAVCEESRIPYALLRSDSADPSVWPGDAVAAIERTLDGGPGGSR
jgi:uncharacterized protein YbjT (DUF2867 family)